MATNKKRIQAYVNLSTYEFLKLQAKDRGMSLSEFVGEVLQTQNASSFESTSFANDDSFVTKKQLLSILDKYRQEIERLVVREVNRAELQWEANANALAAFDKSLLGAVSGLKSGKKFQDEDEEEF